ncbi:hypothetical protein BSKO_08669 [Bryopsis sp. KO-2023]|nr:hypothetical protein BSKO_08669 [Bryopsis sp. KO-2023]
MSIEREPQLLCVLLKKHFKTIKAAIEKLLVWKDRVISISSASSGLSTTFLTVLAVISSELHVSQLSLEPPLDELYQKLGGAGLQSDTDEFVGWNDMFASKLFDMILGGSKKPSFRWVVMAAKIKERITCSKTLAVRVAMSKRIEKNEAEIKMLNSTCDKNDCRIDVLLQELRESRSSMPDASAQSRRATMGERAAGRQVFKSSSDQETAIPSKGFPSVIPTVGTKTSFLWQNAEQGSAPLTPSKKKAFKGMSMPLEKVEADEDITGFAFVAPSWADQDNATDTELSETTDGEH